MGKRVPIDTRVWVGPGKPSRLNFNPSFKWALCIEATKANFRVIVPHFTAVASELYLIDVLVFPQTMLLLVLVLISLFLSYFFGIMSD